MKWSFGFACLTFVVFAFSVVSSHAQDHTLHSFERQHLTDVYFSEGANFGDLNGDGKLDAIHGPYWWQGPKFNVRREIFEPKPQNRDGYSNNFFTWVYDFTGDGWNDLVSVGLPGSPAVLYINPGEGKVLEEKAHWETRKVFHGVGNESPQFVNLISDAQPELICNFQGKLGYATFDVKKPNEPWMWHAVSENVGGYPFQHGLGVGDVNGDGRQDVIYKDGWFEQPKSLDGDPIWTLHKYQFAGPGGADMFAYDVDGDGDNDVITSLAAHTYGLAWFESDQANGRRQPPGDAETKSDATKGLTPPVRQEISFKKHLIVGDKAEDSPYGVLFTEPHAVELHDMDGDGLKDIVTGKTYWSHHRQSPMWDAGAVVYWFKLQRNKGEPEASATGPTVDWIPYLADGESGIGRQLNIADVDGDKLPDIIAGGMVGAHVLRHRVKSVSKDEWLEAQPLKKKPVAMADGLSPQEAAKQMTVPPGFKASLVAGEPLVHQPVAFTFDARGRIWVAEAYTYPNRAKEGEGKDKIVILEDKDGDGYHETRKVFIEGLNLVSGLELGFGGVWVGAAPYLMFIPDRDGDDVPDSSPVAPRQESRPGNAATTTQDASKKDVTSPSAVLSRSDRATLQFPRDVPAGATVLLDGFGWQDTHETLNAFTWGPDGWLYGCHGVFTHSKVGKPGTDEKDRTPMNAAVWRYHPTKHVFEIFANGASNQWGVDFNEHGHAFITACVIPHLYHVIQGARYQRQGGQHFNPYTFEDIKTIADHQHYVGNIRDHAWWGHEPHSPTDTLSAGGGHAHAGAMIYLGDNFPPQYRNTIFMSNIHGNRVNQDVLVRKGSGYVGKHGKDLLIANDRWFRGINLKTGPDGSVYVIDWYDKNACHRTNSEIWDRTNGRIYNVRYVRAEGRVARGEGKATDLAKLGDEELFRVHKHTNEWQSRMARRILQERAANGSLTHEKLVIGLDLPEREPFPNRNAEVVEQLRQMWLAHSVSSSWGDNIQGEPPRFILEEHNASQRMRDTFDKLVREAAFHPMSLAAESSEVILGWQIQLLLNERAEFTIDKPLNDHDREFLVAAASKPGVRPLARLYVASGLQRIPVSDRWKIAEGLLSHAEDADDHNLPLMYWYGIEPLVAADPERALELANKSKIPKVANFIIRRAASDEKSLDSVFKMLTKAHPDGQQVVINEVLAAFEGRVNIAAPESWKPAYDVLAKSDNAAIRDKADQIAVIFGDQRVLPKMRELLVNDKAPLEKRQQALDILLRGRDKDAVASFQAIVSDTTLRGAAIRALSGYDDAKTPSVVLAQYGKLTEAEKRDAINTLCTRPSYAATLLDAIEKEKLPRTDLHAYNVQSLLRFNDEKLQARIKSVWGEFRATAKDKQELIAKHKANLTPARVRNGDLSNGRRLYAKTCQNCHTLFGEGQKVGPDITGSNRANLDYILENMLDPSAIVGKDYRATIIETKDGRVVNGLIQKETDSAITLRTINDTIVIAKADIEERKLSDLSIMPEGQLNTLTPDEIRDLVAYLGSPMQVALRGPKSPIDSKTGKVPDALEGESLKVLKVSAGNAAPQGMGGFAKDKWSGNSQLWWTGGRAGARLDLELPVAADGVYSLELALTKARDYGIVQVRIDDETFGSPIDCFNNPDVITTGVLSFEPRKLAKGLHKLTFEIVGKHADAVPGFMVGVDYVRLVTPTK